MEQLAVGTVVKVRCHGEEILSRRVARDCGRVAVVCNETEYQKAKQEGRGPDGIGFRRSEGTYMRSHTTPRQGQKQKALIRRLDSESPLGAAGRGH